MTQLRFLLALLFSALASSTADDSTEGVVSCGSAIKLTHVSTTVGKYLLIESEGKNRGSGSGQNLATWKPNDASATRALWWVRPAHHGVENQEYPPQLAETETCAHAAAPIRCGHVIRLTNVDTQHKLHSHDRKSPLTGQQEVTAFGGGNDGDTGDNWKVECSGTYWKREEDVRLLHVDTNKYLGSSSNAEFNEKTCGRNCPLMHHLEAFGRGSKDAFTVLQAEQGIYLHI